MSCTFLNLYSSLYPLRFTAIQIYKHIEKNIIQQDRLFELGDKWNQFKNKGGKV